MSSLILGAECEEPSARGRSWAGPRAPQRPHRHEKHGDVRVDDYHWLRERDNPEVEAYLEAENAYLREVTSATAAFEERLFEEIKGRIRQTDMSAPYREGAYRYYPAATRRAGSTRFTAAARLPAAARRVAPRTTSR